MTASQQPWALQDLAQQFAEEWDDLLKAVFPAAPDFDVETRGSKFVVHPTGRVVPLFVQQERLASLEVTASCVWDSESRYLAVERSQFTLAADLDRTPILRFDYVRNMNDRPHSHIQATVTEVRCPTCCPGRHTPPRTTSPPCICPPADPGSGPASRTLCSS